MLLRVVSSVQTQFSAVYASTATRYNVQVTMVFQIERKTGVYQRMCVHTFAHPRVLKR